MYSFIFISTVHSVRCPEPGLVEHGDVHAPSQTVGSTHTYTCDPGFMLFGNATRECGSSGEWIGEKPICWSESDTLGRIDYITVTSSWGLISI